VDDATDALWKAGDVEVDQESQNTAGGLEVAADLGCVHRGEAIDGLQLYDERISDQKIHLSTSDALAFVLHEERRLLVDGYPTQVELDAHRALVEQLRISWPQDSMNLGGRLDHRGSQFVETTARFEPTVALPRIITFHARILGNTPATVSSDLTYSAAPTPLRTLPLPVASGGVRWPLVAFSATRGPTHLEAPVV
jgi:hypothetical protein